MFPRGFEACACGDGRKALEDEFRAFGSAGPGLAVLAEEGLHVGEVDGVQVAQTGVARCYLSGKKYRVMDGVMSRTREIIFENARGSGLLCCYLLFS